MFRKYVSLWARISCQFPDHIWRKRSKCTKNVRTALTRQVTAEATRVGEKTPHDPRSLVYRSGDVLASVMWPYVFTLKLNGIFLSTDTPVQYVERRQSAN